jgi:hypothetical protein
MRLTRFPVRFLVSRTCHDPLESRLSARGSFDPGTWNGPGAAQRGGILDLLSANTDGRHS